MDRAPIAVRVTEIGNRVRRLNPWVIDTVLGTVFVVVGVVSHLSDDSVAGYHDPNAFSLVLVLLATAPYYFRRYAPLPVLCVSVTSVVILVTNDYPEGALPLFLLVGMYTVAAYCCPRDRVIGLLVAGVNLTVLGIVGGVALGGLEVLFQVAMFLAAYFVGATIRNRRLYSAQLEERAAALERERDNEAKRAVADERLRIAQELHDVVAHSMGVIAVQAGVGAHVIDENPREAKKSLDAIAQTSRSTLAEIRHMLGVLREDSGAAYAPAPGLADLELLVRDVRTAGVDVDVQREGTHTELPPGVDFTAYRIVQEALTNVLKHAGQAHATVTIGYEPEALRVEIVDDGRGVNGRALPGGHGLMGMRERAGVYGGTFEAGPRTGGGFRVAVRLPYGDAS